jgi:hypothetical protein
MLAKSFAPVQVGVSKLFFGQKLKHPPVSDSEHFCGLIATTKLFLASERRE